MTARSKVYDKKNLVVSIDQKKNLRNICKSAQIPNS